MLSRNKKTKHSVSQNAFSFIEVIISLFVLSVGFLGVIRLATVTLNSSFLQRDSAIASLLVQEGIELVYNVRDTNVARHGEAQAFDGDSSIPTDNITAGNFRIDYSAATLQPRTTFEDFRLFLSNNTHFYTNTTAGASRTKFLRRISIEASGPPSPDVRRITVLVVWGGESFPNSLNACTLASKCSFAQAELQQY